MTAAVVLIAPLLMASATPAVRPDRLVVYQAELNEVHETLRQPLDEAILTEFQELGRYEVLGGSDIIAMLENEAQKQLLGCEDTQECLAQVAGAMDAQLIAKVNVAKVGDGYLVSIKIINVRSITVVSRVSVKSALDDARLVDAARTAVRVLTASANVGDTLPEVTAPPIVLWAVGAAALGTGIGFGVDAMARQRDFRDPTYADYEGAAERGRRSQTIANIAFGSAALAVGAGLLTWWLGGDRVEVLPDEETDSAQTVASAVLPGGRR